MLAAVAEDMAMATKAEETMEETMVEDLAILVEGLYLKANCKDTSPTHTCCQPNCLHNLLACSGPKHPECCMQDLEKDSTLPSKIERL